MLGVNHLGTQACDNYWSDAPHRWEKFTEAEADSWSSPADRGKALGADRLSTLPSANSLAGMQFSQGKFAEDDALFRCALTGGEKAPVTGRSMASDSIAAFLAKSYPFSAPFNSEALLASGIRSLGVADDRRGSGDDARRPGLGVSAGGPGPTSQYPRKRVKLPAEPSYDSEAKDSHFGLLTGRVGSDRLPTLPPTKDLAGMKSSQGRSTEAEAHSRRALTGGEEAPGPWRVTA